MDKETAQLMLALQEQIDDLWRYLGHDQRAKEARQKANEWTKRRDEIKVEIQEYFVSINEQYSRNMIAAAVIGYAGYFATWGFVRDLLEPNHNFIIALMGMISVGVYSFWEILVINLRSKVMNKFGSLLRDALDAESFDQRRIEIQSDEARLLTLLAPVWWLVINICVVSIAIGGGVMCYDILVSLSETAQQ